jgi:uncharacterized membrane protein
MFDTWFSSSLAEPLLLTGLVVLPLLVWYFHRGLVDQERWQRLASLVCRIVLVSLLLLALAGWSLLQPTQEMYVIFLLDRSQSIGPEGRQAGERYLDQALEHQGRHRVGFVTFAAEPGPVLPVRPSDQDAEPTGDGATNLELVIGAGAGALTPGYVPHLVLLSDGNQTSGDSLRAAARAGVPISTVPLPAREEPEVQLSELIVPAQVREGEGFVVQMVVDSNHDTEAFLELHNGTVPVPGVREPRRKIHRGTNRFRFPQPALHQRLAIYRGHVYPLGRDHREDNNSATGLVYCSGKPRVLIVDNEPRQADDLARALEEQGIEVDPPRPPQGMPTSLSDLQQYELLILSNVPATKLKQRQLQLLRSYVRDLGGGFLMLGGDQSFGLGGYSRSVLEDILPVHCDFKKEKEKPSLAMVLVIDRSGSMASEQKLELTKEAARGAVELLGPNDQIGVLTFDTQNDWACELHAASDKNYVTGKIDRIEIGGGTRIYPALADAFKALQEVGPRAKFKHILLLTDGIDSSNSAAEFVELATQIKAARITLTTLAVGGDADTNLLSEMANHGGGRFYQAEPAAVPQIFAKETIAAGGEALRELPFVPVVFRQSPVVTNIRWREAPYLYGYVMTRAKETAELILMTDKGDPLLAWMRAGLGMSVAFTSDAKQQWAAEWITSQPELYSRFWAQVARQAMRKNEAKGIEVNIVRHDRRATVTLDALDPAGRFLNDAQAELTVLGPRNLELFQPMRQSLPGRYIADFEADNRGDYHLQVSLKRQQQVLFQQSRGLVVGYPDELRLQPPNTALLQAIAGASGGSYSLAPEDVFDPGERTVQRVTVLWPHLLLAAALLMVLDVALRRLDLALLFGNLGRRILFVLSRGKQ